MRPLGLVRSRTAEGELWTASMPGSRESIRGPSSVLKGGSGILAGNGLSMKDLDLIS
jgi:hypothetical protein